MILKYFLQIDIVKASIVEISLCSTSGAKCSSFLSDKIAFLTLPFISLAAFLVNVRTNISRGETPDSIILSIKSNKFFTYFFR